MNLWDKRVGQLAFAVALFFFSCEEETSYLGYPNPDSKYELSFIDIPVKSSNMLYDSIRTTNFYTTNDLARLLVGHYSDPVFGDVTASSYTQFVPDGSLAGNLGDSLTLVFDSAYLRLRVGYGYAYGTTASTTQKINVYEIADPLEYNTEVTIPGNVGGQQKPVESTYYRQKEYFTNSEVTYNASALCSGEIKANLADLNDINKAFYLNMKLDSEFAERLFDRASQKDSTFTDLSIFTTLFPGLAIVAEEGSDKIIGINPIHDSTYLRLHYHVKRIIKNTIKTDSLVLDFNLNRSSGFISFNKIETDRTGTDLAGLNYYEEDESSLKRYIQAGTGVVTKIDFSAFLDSLQSIPRLAINSAEFIIDNTDNPQHFNPPQGLLVKLIKENNRPKKLTHPGKSSAYRKDAEDLSAYTGFVNYDNANSFTFTSGIPFDSTFNIVDDAGGFLTLLYDDDTRDYKGKASLFFQKLHALSLSEEEETLYTTAVLIPYSPGSRTSQPVYGRHINGKSVNRVSFNKDNIRLRVYYTIPTITQNQ
ncbi:MAG TPA: DUF4270 family protein [Ohtaekwangia sp.]